MSLFVLSVPGTRVPWYHFVILCLLFVFHCRSFLARYLFVFLLNRTIVHWPTDEIGSTSPCRRDSVPLLFVGPSRPSVCVLLGRLPGRSVSGVGPRWDVEKGYGTRSKCRLVRVDGLMQYERDRRYRRVHNERDRFYRSV